jgi:hypothetical protein
LSHKKAGVREEEEERKKDLIVKQWIWAVHAWTNGLTIVVNNLYNPPPPFFVNINRVKKILKKYSGHQMGTLNIDKESFYGKGSFQYFKNNLSYW